LRDVGRADAYSDVIVVMTSRDVMMMCVTQWCGQDERCHRLQLPDLLISPMQHCTKVPLLLHNIGRYTLDPTEQQMLTESLRTLEASLGNEQRRT